MDQAKNGVGMNVSDEQKISKNTQESRGIEVIPLPKAFSSPSLISTPATV